MFHEIRSLLPYVPVLLAIHTVTTIAFLMISQTRVKGAESVKFILIKLGKFHIKFNIEKNPKIKYRVVTNELVVFD